MFDSDLMRDEPSGGNFLSAVIPERNSLGKKVILISWLASGCFKNSFLLRPKIPTKNLHEWGLGEADRAEI